MRTLLIHQNFPGQYRYLAPALARQKGAQVVALGDKTNVRDPGIANLKVIGYESPRGATPQTHHYIRGLEGGIRRGQNVARVGITLRDQGFTPDVVVVHPGWGDALFLRDVWPDTRIINYFEFYYRTSGFDVGFDTEFENTVDDRLRLRMKNALNLFALDDGDWGLSPTHFQRSAFPDKYRSRISVIFDGVDTERIAPLPDGTDIALTLPDGRKLTPQDEVLSFVNRNLEPYRGYHRFMRALPELQKRRPKLHCVLIGGDEVSYGRAAPDGTTHKQVYLDEVKDRLDMDRLHFLGRVPYEQFLTVLHVARAHLYLTYPFVLSWSLIEAMSLGKAIAGSRTGPVMEAIEHEKTGLLFDFFDQEGLIDSVERLLDDEELRRALGAAARADAVARYDLKSKCLPAQLELLHTVADGKTPATPIEPGG